jgi:hypothetical protein
MTSDHPQQSVEYTDSPQRGRDDKRRDDRSGRDQKPLAPELP